MSDGMTRMQIKLALLLILAVAGCDKLGQVGRAPEFSPLVGTDQHYAMHSTNMPQDARSGPTDASSLWSGGTDALFGDRRAARRGDILTVVIEIDDSAAISNTTGRNRSGTQRSGIGQLFGIPQRIDDVILPDGASMEEAYESNSSSTFRGTGNVSRQEQLTLRVAATVVEELPNGVLRIEGQQEVRVNFEMRELIVTGYVRPIDISRNNEITYDKIAGARISYGGKGQITDFQQPTYGQQAADILIPF